MSGRYLSGPPPRLSNFAIPAICKLSEWTTANEPAFSTAAQCTTALELAEMPTKAFTRFTTHTLKVQ